MYNFIQEMEKMVFMFMLASPCFATQLKIGGTNVCRRSVSYSTYGYKQIYKVVYRSYRTRGAWWKRKTVYRSESKSSQELEVITKYKSVYTCCRGWSRKNDHCPIPICASGCRNGNCTAPNRCTCHKGYHGCKCQHASSGGVTAVKNVFERIHINRTVVMEWKIAHNDNQTDKVLKLYVLPDRARPVFSSYGKYKSLQWKGRRTFGNRLSATFNKIKSIYTATLKRIQYNENYTFQLKVVFRNKKSVTETKITDIRIKNVVGGPDICGNGMESIYTAKEGERLSIVQDICGHPKPVVQWKLNEDMFVSSLKSTLINDTIKHYRYSYESRFLRRSDCGKYIIFNASNEAAAIKQNAMIDVIFKPSPVSIKLMYRINESCVYVGWFGESAENCSVKYYFQFDGENSRHEISTVNFVHCGLQNARSVVFWASYKNIIGEKTNALLVYENISPLTKKSNKDEGEGQCANKITIVIIVTVIAALISNIIIICVCIKSKGAGTCNIKQACRKQKETNKTENKYDTIRKFSNCQDVKKGAKKMDVQNEYAEIALNLMEKNIYYAPAQT